MARIEGPDGTEALVDDADANRASSELDAIEASAGGFGGFGGGGGGLQDPATWVTAINDAKDWWFSSFEAQRAGQENPCYQMAFVAETWSRWFLGTQGQEARALLAAKEAQLARLAWQAGAWREGVAQVVRGRISGATWASCLDFDAARKVASTRVKLPDADAIDVSEPTAYLNANQCIEPMAQSGRRRYVKVGAGLYFDRVDKELFGPGLPSAYDAAADSAGDPAMYGGSLWPEVEGLRAAVAGWDQTRDLVRALYFAAQRDCQAWRAQLDPQNWVRPTVREGAAGNVGTALDLPSAVLDPTLRDPPTPENATLRDAAALVAILAFFGLSFR